MSEILYQIRDAQRVVQGAYTRDELVKLIHKGKFTGEEEVSLPPYTNWQKLASHSDFFDEFIGRLFDKEYQRPKERTRKEKKRREEDQKKTVFEKTIVAPENVPVQPASKTEAHPADEAADNQTIHQSDIDKLFGSSEEEEPPANGTSVLQTERMGADYFPPAQTDYNPAREWITNPNQEITGARGIKKSRPLLIVALLVVLAFFLVMRAGDNSEEIEKKKAAGEKKIESKQEIEEKYTNLIQEADYYFDQDDLLSYKGAALVYEQAMRSLGDRARSYARIAEAKARMLGGLGDSQKIQDEIKAALAAGRKLEPQLGAFYRVESLQSLASGDLTEAGRFMLKAVEADPVSSENYLVMGEVALSAQETGRAKFAFDKAIAGLPTNVRAKALRAEIALSDQEYAKAKELATAANRLNPLHARTLLVLGDLATLENRWREAFRDYELASRQHDLAPKNLIAQAYWKLGRFLESSSNSEGASKAFRLAYYFSDDPSDALKAKVKDLDISSGSLKTLAESDRYDKQYFEEWAAQLKTQSRWLEALKCFLTAWLYDPSDSKMLVSAGEVAEKVAASAQDFKKIANLYERAIQTDPTNPLGYLRLGMLETDQYNFDKGYDLISQGLAISPQNTDLLIGLGKHYYKRQDYVKAMDPFIMVHQVRPGDSEVNYYAGLIRLMLKKEAGKEAAHYFYQAYQADPQNYDALAEWLKIKVINYERNFAIKLMRNLIEGDAKNPDLYWVMGELYSTDKEYRKAIGYYYQAIDLDNRNSKYRMSVGRSLEAIGELGKAVAEYQQASQLDPRNSEGYYRAADILFNIRKVTEAEDALNQLIKVTPNYPGAYRYLSKIAHSRGQKEKAVQLLKQEVANNPKNYKFRLELAELMMEYLQFDQAITQLNEVTNLPSVQKAPEYYHEKIRGYLLLSRCYRAANKPESAESSIKLALQLDNNDPELHREFGYVYYTLQKDKEAVKEFEYYLKRNPAARDADLVKSLIEKMRIEE